MEPRVNVITLGVADLERALAFYRDGLGLPTEGIVGTEFEEGAVVFITVGADLVLALYPTDALAGDAAVPVPARTTGGFSIGHLVGSRDEVDAVMAQAEDAGARVTDPARDRFWGGYSGYFADLDGHLWEVAWNPAWSAPAP